ncbi:pyridoxamine 5'-phosphate oxidase [Kingella negevensis]|uniref:pyridoxamine 5'-phosphate oxidase n=1 Tax=Kingella negevensis TaxID=1522312 RepID=UPI00254C166D|nr:pyridoxamine 5'-phosphate oxidase [Kingella negevensis]MDK4679640.1 pyridoxamine 5'-phosphate oxidase [Kingella negevensis]MDK4682641.1 pyridoxamine 5'-phosphate oxidase [Kingella negevensis]MDK4690838.1 pyridoxamine 5'-phosphate oxidase [Kingella negevensis]MDK4694015.1 pyridoxamine 5'-phosphate oxidase [Kingella negevensis]MDK4699743.1 pyridoxamine 5'-phosphate oxidase [Kingella negevensis]
MDLHDIRQDYSKRELSKKHCLDNPIAQFEQWMNEAMASQVPEPTAMNVATVDKDGRPSNRILLLKEVNQQGFVFFSNYHSRKGRALAANPFASLTFFWAELERQVRVEGRVEKLLEHLSDEYFDSRPYTSRVGAWASEQSQVIANKQVIVARAAMFGARHPLHVPRPEHWGGYLVIPDRVEFWQGRPSRLHDRIVYRLENGNWIKERLAP